MSCNANPHPTIEERRSFIKRLRRDLFDLDDDVPFQDRELSHKDKMLKRLLGIVAEDLYEKENHFVRELIQNADDAVYPEGVTPSIGFEVRDNRLIVTYNECGFEEADVKALCSAGDSTKSKSAHQIGEKGIGFKSVFKVTDRPEIHSNGFHFRLDAANLNSGLGHVIPEWIDDVDACVRDGVTTIILPAKGGISFSSETFGDCFPEILLFLHKLKCLRIVVDVPRGTAVSYELVQGPPIVQLATRKSMPDGSEHRSITTMFLAHNRFTISPPLDSGRRQGIGESDLILAFPIREDGSPVAAAHQHVFAYLPVGDFGFRFLVQGDFILTADRTGIHEGDRWNELIRSAIAKAFILSIPALKTHEPLNRYFLSYVPRESEIHGAFFGTVRKAILNDLRGADCVLVESGRWRKPIDALLADASVRSLIPNAELEELLGKEYVSHEVVGSNDVLLDLGCKRFGLDQLLLCLQKPHWLASKDILWFRRLYDYLSNFDIEGNFARSIQAIAMFPIQGGTFASLAQGDIYLPLEDNHLYGFEHEMRILALEIFDPRTATGDGLKPTLQKLGILTATPKDIVDRHILPFHTASAWNRYTDGALLGHVRYIRTHFDEFVKARAPSGGVSAEFAKAIGRELGAKLHLKTQKKRDGVAVYSLAETLYLSSAYLPTVDVELLLGPKANDYASQILSPDYMNPTEDSVGLGEDSENRRNWRLFFASLGVAQLPRVKKQSEIRGRPINYEPDNILRVLGNEVRTAPQLAEILDQHWLDTYRQFAKASEWVRKNSWKQPVKFDSEFMRFVRAMQVPTTNGSVVPLFGSMLDSEALRDVFGDTLPYVQARIVTPEFIEDLGIVAKADISSCLAFIDRLRGAKTTESVSLKRIFRELERFAERSPNDAAEIRKAFADQERILVSSAERPWRSSRDVCWRARGILGRIVPPLEDKYRDFRTFFQKIGVPSIPHPDQLIAGLGQLATLEPLAEDRLKGGIEIFVSLNRALDEHRRRSPRGVDPGWVTSLREKGPLLDDRANLRWRNDRVLFNDAPKLAALFRDLKGIHFWCVTQDDLGAQSDLASSLDVPRLSMSIRETLHESVSGRLDEGLTSILHSRIRQLVRLLHGKSPIAAEEFVEQRKAVHLMSVKVWRPESLLVDVTLFSHTVVSDETAYLDEAGIYVKEGARREKDKVAIAICPFLGLKPDESRDLISLLLDAKDEEEAGFLLDERGISDLPKSLMDEIDVQIREAEKEPFTSGAQELESASNMDVADGEPAYEVDGVVQPQLGVDVGGNSTSGLPSANDQTQNTITDSIGLGTPAAPPDNSITSADFVGTSHRASAADEPGDNLITPASSVSVSDARRSQIDDSVEREDAKSRTGEEGSGGVARDGGSHGSQAKPLPGHSPRDRVVTYVLSKRNSEMDDESSSNSNQEYLIIGEAAEQWVFEYEKQLGNIVERQEHANRGFDILRRRTTGDDEYIEVKGTKGDWNEHGVALTPPQVEFAREKGDRFWLYVVEHALEPPLRRLTRIRDPLGKATEYRFDYGWKGLGEDSSSVAPEPSVGKRLFDPENGNGTITHVQQGGKLFRLDVQFDDGTSKTTTFIPGRMTLLD